MGHPAFSSVLRVDFRSAAPKGASDFEELMVSLKRYPDTKPKFFQRTMKLALKMS
jgi:hypothetical protein